MLGIHLKVSAVSIQLLESAQCTAHLNGFLAKVQARFCIDKGIIAKRKERKIHKDARKFEKLKQRFEKAEVMEPEKAKRNHLKDLL